MIEKKILPRRSQLMGTRVAVVDGDKDFLNSIAALLRAEGMHVEAFRSAAEAYDSFRARLPEAIVVSREMQGPTGMQILETIRRYSDVPILMTSKSEDDLDEVMAFRLGANDYVRKPLRERALVERVRAKLRRARATMPEPVKIHVPPAANLDRVCEYGPMLIDEDRAVFTFKGVTIRATVAELRVMTCLMRHPEVIRSRETLHELIDHNRRGGRLSIVDTHIKRIRQKIRAVDPDCNPISTHYGLGYALNRSIA